MLTPEDVKELKPKFEEIHRHLNFAILHSGSDISDDAARRFVQALLLMEDLVHMVERKMWSNLATEFQGDVAVVGPPRASTVLHEMIEVLLVGVEAGVTDDLKGCRPEFEAIHRHLNFAILMNGANISADAAKRFVETLLLMKNLTKRIEQKIWDDIKVASSSLFEEFARREEEQEKGDDSRSSWWKDGWERTFEHTWKRTRDTTGDLSAEKAGLLGGLGAGTAAAIATGGGGFGIAAGGTAVGIAGLAGATVATGGAGLAGAAALYLGYKAIDALYNTEQGKRTTEQTRTFLSERFRFEGRRGSDDGSTSRDSWGERFQWRRRRRDDNSDDDEN